MLHLKDHCFISKCLKTTKALKNTKILLRIGKLREYVLGEEVLQIVDLQIVGLLSHEAA